MDTVNALMVKADTILDIIGPNQLTEAASNVHSAGCNLKLYVTQISKNQKRANTCSVIVLAFMIISFSNHNIFLHISTVVRKQSRTVEPTLHLWNRALHK